MHVTDIYIFISFENLEDLQKHPGSCTDNQLLLIATTVPTDLGLPAASQVSRL